MSKKIGNPAATDSEYVKVLNQSKPTDNFITRIQLLSNDYTNRKEFNQKSLDWANNDENFSTENIDKILEMLGQRNSKSLVNQLNPHRKANENLYHFDDSQRKTLLL